LTSDEATRLEVSELEAFSTRGVVVIDGDASRASSHNPKIWVLCAKFNGGISARLCHGALDAFDAFGMQDGSVRVAWVPGAFELPLAARRSITDAGAQAVVCLGAVIRGDTPHFDFVASECASGLQRVNLDTGVPVVFGVLTTETVDQALERSVPGVANKGYEAAITALEMLDLLPRIVTQAPIVSTTP
jgi:6,7-dimethyl-8-ribityllumazine synthase